MKRSLSALAIGLVAVSLVSCTAPKDEVTATSSIPTSSTPSDIVASPAATTPAPTSTTPKALQLPPSVKIQGEKWLDVLDVSGGGAYDNKKYPEFALGNQIMEVDYGQIECGKNASGQLVAHFTAPGDTDKHTFEGYSIQPKSGSGAGESYVTRDKEVFLLKGKKQVIWDKQGGLTLKDDVNLNTDDDPILLGFGTATCEKPLG